MKVFGFVFTLLLSAGLTSAIKVIDVKNRHFVYAGTDDAFFVKGIAYQPGGSAGFKDGQKDVLADKEVCLRDVAVFQKLGINAIRVYHVHPDNNHDECMSILAAAGIYVILDVNSGLPLMHMHSTEPWTTYHKQYLERVFKIIEVFSGYDNLLGFIAANELNDSKSKDGIEKAAPYLKAVIRDMKAYIRNHIHRRIPIGVADAEVPEIQESMSVFLECGDVHADFYGVNSYSWCGDRSFEGSDYEKYMTTFKDYSIPLLLTEYGCIVPRPRVFTDVKEIFGQMTPVFAGALMYEYTREKQADGDYGLVLVKSDKSLQYLEEFPTFKKEHTAVKPTVDVNADKKDRPAKCPDTILLIKDQSVPATQGADMIKNGVPKDKFKKGRFVEIKEWKTSLEVVDESKNKVSDKEVEPVESIKQNDILAGGYDPLSADELDKASSAPSKQHGTDSPAGSKKKNSGTVLRFGPGSAAAACLMVAAIFL